ncbi:hypothetical protein MLD38_004344 [Melastoma candidum]|uniref:Uncharacterized protein n=1 Tax=Melastoma candidum TaxID=119954 RepID=A0ACB9S5C2_9MYRT|nr:hypothetical protein MLD38_004344 [Melastoma candidum]
MDSSAKSERGKPTKPLSNENGERISSQRSPWNVELNITSTSSSCDSQQCDLDGYHGDTDSSTRFKMDLFMKTQNSAATSSYSSSDKYWEDYFRVMLSEGVNTQADVLVLCENSDAGSSLTSRLSTERASMVSDITQESLIRTASPGQSPPQQGMVRSGGYDPKRIPSSVFERSKCQSSAPVEWSIASTESLFSIHLGTINFSKEQFLPLMGDPQKPEELDKIDGAVTLPPPLQGKKASDSQISQQERSSHEQDEEASDGPISQLERNSHENEDAAGEVNAVKLEQGNGCGIIEEKMGDLVVTYMPSLNNSRYDRSSSLPLKKKRSRGQGLYVVAIRHAAAAAGQAVTINVRVLTVTARAPYVAVAGLPAASDGRSAIKDAVMACLAATSTAAILAVIRFLSRGNCAVIIVTLLGNVGIAVDSELFIEN